MQDHNYNELYQINNYETNYTDLINKTADELVYNSINIAVYELKIERKKNRIFLKNLNKFIKEFVNESIEYSVEGLLEERQRIWNKKNKKIIDTLPSSEIFEINLKSTKILTDEAKKKYKSKRIELQKLQDLENFEEKYIIVKSKNGKKKYIKMMMNPIYNPVIS